MSLVKSVIRLLQIVFVLLGLSYLNPLCADTSSLSPASSSTSTALGATSSINLLGTGGQVLLVLMFIIALLFVLTWFLKRSGLARQAANGHLKVLGGVSVGQRERVLLLQVGQDQILVGVTSVEITLLHMLSQPIEIDEQSDLNHSSFAQQLQALINRRVEK